MIIKFISAALVAALAGCTPSTEASSPAPVQNRGRVFSTGGFSFLPPQGSNWSEEFGKNQILYTKKTDTRVVSFYTGAVDGRLPAALPDKASLVEFVRLKKDKWGDEGRFSAISSSFQIEAERESCVRYWLSAQDRKAKNKGDHAFLLMQSVGRFCLQPQDATAAVDVFYSVRSVPRFDQQGLMAEGEEFLKSLQFSPLPEKSAAHVR